MNCTCCKGCEKRKVNCHSWCEEYQAWNKQHQAEREELERTRSFTRVLDGIRIDRKAKWLRDKAGK